jgi:protein-tyrosine phosphatase
VKWRDFWLPSNRLDATNAFVVAWQRSAHERVEVSCNGGRGRTGTALACIAVLDGLKPSDAIDYVRDHYDHHAVETPWQTRFVKQFVASRVGVTNEGQILQDNTRRPEEET